MSNLDTITPISEIEVDGVTVPLATIGEMPDLSEFYTKTEVDELVANIPEGIETLVGTIEKPINFATDMEYNQLYFVKGPTVGTSTSGAWNNPYGYLMLKRDPLSGNRAYVYVYGGHGKPITFYDVSGVGVLHIDIETGYVVQYDNYVTIPETINGVTSTQRIYAPITSGTSGQILQSSGSSKAPT